MCAKPVDWKDPPRPGVFIQEYMGEFEPIPPMGVNFRRWSELNGYAIFWMRHERACEVCPMHLVCATGGLLAPRGDEDFEEGCVGTCEDCGSVLFIDNNNRALYICALLAQGQWVRNPMHAPEVDNRSQMVEARIRCATNPGVEFRQHPPQRQRYGTRTCRGERHACCGTYYMFMLMDEHVRTHFFIPEGRGDLEPYRLTYKKWSSMLRQIEEEYMRRGGQPLRLERIPPFKYRPR